MLKTSSWINTRRKQSNILDDISGSEDTNTQPTAARKRTEGDDDKQESYYFTLCTVYCVAYGA